MGKRKATTSLEQFRRKAGLTQSQLAEAAGLSQTCISFIELGKRIDVPLSTARGIVRALNKNNIKCTLAEVFPERGVAA